MTDHIVLSRKYFAEAVRLAPEDWPFKGFLATQSSPNANCPISLTPQSQIFISFHFTQKLFFTPGGRCP
jgi:hypothetical protein